MRNLKRALSLTLASVMLLGMMVVGSSALSFNDADGITNVTAATVLEDLGIMQGDGQGNFMPEATVTRAQMAIIICRILYGNKLNVSQFEGTTQYNDVGANDYYTGYINLATQLGIIAGYGDGRFGPNDTVTTAQAALMLSRALGYFKGNEIAQASDWALASIAQATKINMFGNLNLATNAGLARDNVAEMVFNTITKAVPVQYNELLGVYYNENQGIIYSLEFNYLQTLAYKNFDLVYDSDTQDIYGRPATTWGTGTYNVNSTATSSGTVNNTNNLTDRGGLIASNVRMKEVDEIITVPNTPTYVYTENTKEKVVYNDLGRTVVSGTESGTSNPLYTWVWYINGLEQTASNGGTREKPLAGSDNRYEYTAKGTQTEIYVDDYDLKVTVVEINYYIGQVSSVKEDSNGRYITVKELSKGSDLDVRTFYTNDFVEDDYVIYTMDYIDDDRDYVIGEVFEPDIISGNIARVENDKDDSSTYLRFEKNGTKYPYSFYWDLNVSETSRSKNGFEQQSHMIFDLDADTVPTAGHPTLEVEYDLLRDPNGYVVAFRETNKQPDKYLYVQDTDEEYKDWGAKVVLEDATNPVITLDKDLDVPAQASIDNKDSWSTTNDPTPNSYANTIKWIKYDIASAGQVKTSNIDGRIWKYSVGTDNKYSLEFVETFFMGDGNDGHAVKTAEIHNGRAYTTWKDDANGNNTGFIVDKNTIFVDVDGKKAYIGYEEVPNVADATLAYTLGGSGDLVAKVVFILEGEIYDENQVYFMLTSDSRESLKRAADGKNYREYSDAWVNGDKTTVTVRYNALVDQYDNPVSPDKLVAGKLYKVLQTKDDEYITKVVEVPMWATKYAVSSANGAFWLSPNYQGAVTDNRTVKYDVANDTIFVLAEKLPKDRSLWKDSGYNAVAYDNAGGEWEWKVARSNQSSITIEKDAENFYTHIIVVKDDNNHQTAKLVYIIREQQYPAPTGITVTGNSSPLNSSLLGPNNEPLAGQEFLPGTTVKAKIPADQLTGKKVTDIKVNDIPVPADKITVNQDGSVSFEFTMPEEEGGSVEVNITVADTTIDTITAKTLGEAADIKAGKDAPAVPALDEAGFTVTTAGTWTGAAYDDGTIKAEGGALTLTYKVKADEGFSFAPKAQMTLPTLFGATGEWTAAGNDGIATIKYTYTVEKKPAFDDVVPVFMLGGVNVTDTIAASVKDQVKADFDGTDFLELTWDLPDGYTLADTDVDNSITVTYVEGSRKVTVDLSDTAFTNTSAKTVKSKAAETALKAKASATVLNVTINLAGSTVRDIDWKVAADAGYTCYIATDNETWATTAAAQDAAVEFTLTDLPEWAAEVKVTYTVTGTDVSTPAPATKTVTDGETATIQVAAATSNKATTEVGVPVVIEVTKVEVTKVNYKVEFETAGYKTQTDLSAGVGAKAVIPTFDIEGDGHTIDDGAIAKISYTVSGVTETEDLTVDIGQKTAATAKYTTGPSTAQFTPAMNNFVTIKVKVELVKVVAQFNASSDTGKMVVTALEGDTKGTSAGADVLCSVKADGTVEVKLTVGKEGDATKSPVDGVYTVKLNGKALETTYTVDKTADGWTDTAKEFTVTVPANMVTDATMTFTVERADLPAATPNPAPPVESEDD